MMQEFQHLHVLQLLQLYTHTHLINMAAVYLCAGQLRSSSMNSDIDFTTITTPLIDLRGVVIDIDQTLGAETAVLINPRLELVLWLSLCRSSVVSRAFSGGAGGCRRGAADQ